MLDQLRKRHVSTGGRAEQRDGEEKEEEVDEIARRLRGESGGEASGSERGCGQVNQDDSR